MRTLILLIFSFFASTVFAVDVAEEELTSAEEVQFINYEGPQARVFSAETIRGIGSILGEELGTGRIVGRYLRYILLN